MKRVNERVLLNKERFGIPQKFVLSPSVWLIGCFTVYLTASIHIETVALC